MSQGLLIGIDVGTTGAKAIVCDSQGQLLAQAGQEYATAFPHPNWAEQDPDDWWRAAVLSCSGCWQLGIASYGCGCCRR